MRLMMVAAAAAMLAGCAALDKGVATQFDRDGDTFRFRSAEAAVYGPDQSYAWLDEFLADNEMCPRGYDATRDQIIIKSSWGAKDRVIEGHCKP